MTEVKTISGEVLFSYDENTTTLKKEISKHKDLSCADLSGADLTWANLIGADLSGASLIGANIRWANLRLASLSGADLTWADLSGAYVINANLMNANLSYAKLIGTTLYDSNFCNADLIGADLSNADLSYADLKGVNLSYADLNNANLGYAMNMPEGLPMACPTEGSFIAWKKVANRYLIKLEIPEDAKRSSATSKKCRCDKAKVLEITNLETGKNIDEIVNRNYVLCTYTVGKMVYPDSFDENRWNECSNGIHFFVNREDAENYYN